MQPWRGGSGVTCVRVQYWRQLRLIIVDSFGSLFAPVVGGNGLVGHAQLVCAMNAMQVSPGRAALS